MKSLSLAKPHMIIMAGIPGSGKSFFADKFAETFGAPFVSHDRIAAIVDIPPEIIAKLLYAEIDELLKTRQSFIVDGAATTRTERGELAKKARAGGYETLTIWVQTDPATARDRAIRKARQQDIQLTPDDHDRRAKRFTPPHAGEKPVVISGKHTYASQAKVVLKRLTAPRAAISTHDIAPSRDDTHTRRNIIIR